eukprot:CAMPEP_0174261106 /NCGR_PEP_ID=MMETSP0439-20130205/11234_1 /TAXON_ID=0 /ORGANISM="Stereomyxa ramosa, Strain Chinc5" /LENGTH=172 /DNA_ID=CAMNT_0015345529 /DNA_START=25 /DNA_END=543 /DNA_ORIENTATION=+
MAEEGDSTLKEIEVKSHEEDEDVLFKVRAKVFFFRQGIHDDEKEWKERGVGEARFLKHKETGKIRLLVRRDKTFKIAMNHYVTPGMELQENVGSDRAWVYTCPADFSDEKPQEETIAIRFANPENAQLFKEQFEAAQAEMEKLQSAGDKEEGEKEGEKEGETGEDKEEKKGE